jgi:hypothetical protein
MELTYFLLIQTQCYEVVFTNTRYTVPYTAFFNLLKPSGNFTYHQV